VANQAEKKLGGAVPPLAYARAYSAKKERLESQ
jgi:hypothetical protein